MPRHSDTLVTVDLPNHEDAELAISYTFRRGHPGQYYGPPENCYPAEGPEIEITTALHNGADMHTLLTKRQIEQIEEQIINEETDQ